MTWIFAHYYFGKSCAYVGYASYIMFLIIVFSDYNPHGLFNLYGSLTNKHNKWIKNFCNFNNSAWDNKSILPSHKLSRLTFSIVVQVYWHTR